MELEEFISGYCRERDGSRTVLLEGAPGEHTADCSYGSCPYEMSCPIAQRISQINADAAVETDIFRMAESVQPPA